MTTPEPARESRCPAHPAGTAPVALSGPRFHTEPHQLYREMRREHGPVVPVELPGGIPAWLIVNYHEMHQVTSDPELFPRDVSLWNQWPNIPDDWPLLPMIQKPQPSIYFTAGEAHRRHASLVVPALESVDPFELRHTCEQLSDRLIDAFCSRGEADLVSEFAKPLPVLALARLLGYTDPEGTAVARALGELVDGGEGAMRAHQDYLALNHQLIKNKRVEPGDDITSWMLAQDGFTEEEVALNVKDVMGAAFVTTADWIGNSIRLMLTDDRFAAALGGGRHSVGQAMNEVLWEDTPTQILAGRWAARDTLLAGQQIRAGDLVMLGLAAANADPLIQQQFAPSQGGNSAHFSFSHGEYRCPLPAQEIAEIIARTAIEVLLDRLPDVDLAVPAQTLVRRPSTFLRGMTAIPVRFTPIRPTGDQL
ncbi:cytochrome P450 [Streptomyces sp. NPDC094448]|uniref:cytochrome P450 n=1 Tax=Streptomyces sp. NPDC094448 TaxID=3366063 RepID=UPI0038175B10